MITIRIYTDALSYGPMPDPDTPIAQKLTIREDGRCWLSRYTYGSGDYVCSSRGQFRAARPELFPELVKALDALNSNYEHQMYFVTDCGSWTVTVDSDEKGYKLQGSMIDKFNNISDLVRAATGQSDLWVMDGV